MGADACLVIYGVRYFIAKGEDVDDHILEPFERMTDPRIRLAKQHKLQWWFGRDTDGGEYHLYVGRILGRFGVEADTYANFSDATFSELMNRARNLLRAAGLAGEPMLHIQLEAQY